MWILRTKDTEGDAERFTFRLTAGGMKTLGRATRALTQLYPIFEATWVKAFA